MGLKNVVIQGRLVRDPEMRQSHSGTDITTFTVAVDSNRRQQGEEKPKASFFKVTAFGGRGKAVNDHLKKGDEVSVVGDIELDSYQGQDGKTYHNLAVTAEGIHFGRRAQSDNGNQQQLPNNDFAPRREEAPVW